MDLGRRDKVYECVVNARIDACYLLVRDVAQSRRFNLDFGAAQDMADVNNVVLPILADQPSKGDDDGLSLPVGTLEFLRLTTDETLFQVYLGSSLWKVVGLFDSGEGTPGLIDQAATNAPNYVESVWLAILGRFRSLKLVPSYRVGVSE